MMSREQSPVCGTGGPLFVFMYVRAGCGHQRDIYKVDRAKEHIECIATYQGWAGAPRPCRDRRAALRRPLFCQRGRKSKK
jgi:hypothetical protein